MDKHPQPSVIVSKISHVTAKPLLKGLFILFITIFTTSIYATDYASKISYPTVEYGTGKAEQIKRGEYLVKASDCIACHTTEGGKPFAGGLPIKTPFGTIYSPNITSDKETGLGKWSDDDFVQAMREGIAPDGSYYYPVFPFMNFNKFSRQDVLDIKAYLDAIPAVEQKNLPLDMPFPFNVRLTLSFWRFMFFDFYKGEYQTDTRQSPEWNRGAYLVEGPGHCDLCHSPLNILGAPKRQYYLAGGFVDGYSVPNITSFRLGDIPVEKIIAVFKEDQKISGGKVQGPMLQVNHDSLSYLGTEDLTAIAIYLRTVVSKLPPAPGHGTGEKAGKAIYEQYCAGCHNMGGGGAPKFGDPSQWESKLTLGLNPVYDHAIKGIGGMPPKGNCDSCTDEQVKTAVDYIVSHSRGEAGKKIAAPNPSESLTSLARGKQIFDRVCSVCHREGQLGAPKLGDKTAWTPLLKENVDVLVERAINGYKGHPAMGACYQCSDADVIAAVKYMVQEGGDGDYRLW